MFINDDTGNEKEICDLTADSDVCDLTNTSGADDESGTLSPTSTKNDNGNDNN